MDSAFKLAAAFYASVEHDPVLRALYPSKTFKCAIEGLALFLAEVLGGPREYTKTRWSVSLRDIHERLKIGPEHREHWIEKMFRAIDEVGIAEPERSALRRYFEEASTYVVNHPVAAGGIDAVPIEHDLGHDIGRRWADRRTFEEAASAVRSGDAARAIGLAESLDDRVLLLAVLGKMSGSGVAELIGYVRSKLLADPELVRARYATDRTLLHEASGQGRAAIVELLLELGADSNAVDHFGHAPLYYAGNLCAAESGGDVVRALVEGGANVDAHDGAKRCTALHMAARRGHVRVAEALADCGAHIEARDSAGDTPLRRAVNCGQRDVAALLLSRGADLHSVGSRALTPLRAGRGAAMQLLLEASAANGLPGIVEVQGKDARRNGRGGR